MNQHRLRLCVFILVAALSGRVFGQSFSEAKNEQGLICPITLDEALVLALSGNLELKQKKLELSYTEKEAFSSWNAFLPSISLSGGLRNSHRFMPDSSAA